MRRSSNMRQRSAGVSVRGEDGVGAGKYDVRGA